MENLELEHRREMSEQLQEGHVRSRGWCNELKCQDGRTGEKRTCAFRGPSAGGTDEFRAMQEAVMKRSKSGRTGHQGTGYQGTVHVSFFAHNRALENS